MFLMLFSLFQNSIMMVVSMEYGEDIVSIMLIRESNHTPRLNMPEIGNSLVNIGLIIFWHLKRLILDLSIWFREKRP